MMKLFEELEYTRDLTLKCFELSEEDLLRRYSPGKWTVRELLNHIVDAETVLYDRIRRTIAKPGQVIWAFDQDAWCKQLDYMTFPLELNKATYMAVRAAVIYLAQQFYEERGTNGFVHSATGIRTLKDEFDKVAWHNAHHLNQIQLALSI